MVIKCSVRIVSFEFGSKIGINLAVTDIFRYYITYTGLAIACRPSLCHVDGSGSHRLEYFENNFTAD